MLEHTEEKTAQNLLKIASPEFYKAGVNVFGFDKVEEPVLRIASLYSSRNLGGRLYVYGDWVDDYYGFAFGVFDAAEGSVTQD